MLITADALNSDNTLDQKVKELKREIQKKTRTAYWTYIESIITPMEVDEDSTQGSQYQGMKCFWGFIKSGRKDYRKIGPLRDRGTTTEDPKEMADLLNGQFESVFSKDDQTTPDVLPDSSPHPKMPDIVITEPGVRKMLERLKPHKAMGPDEIGPRVLKELAPTIAPILTIIYRRSYETGQIPDDWRRANVVSIYKKGRRCDASNYRPISLTCVCCKVMEHIVASSVMRHARTNHLLYDLQHGFRDRRSCETQLLEFQADILHSLTEGKQTDAIILDFSKAFDKVNHRKLVAKMGHYGVRGKTNDWIRSFLSNRTQAVVLEGARSHEADVKSGVPQGSVLGPCLFLFYINDLPDSLKSHVRLFADDTVVYLTISHQQDTAILQQDLLKLEAWEKAWDMEFHPGKCQVITFTRKREPVVATYYLHGHVLENVKEAKYLGLTLQHDMRYNIHLDNITNKASRTLGFLRRNLQINSPKLKTTAYKALVRPMVEYAPTVWDPYTQKGVKQVEKVQRRAARYVLNRHRNQSSPTEMLEDLKWQTLEERRKQQRLTMMYKITNGHVAVNADKYITPTEPLRTSRHQHSQMLTVPPSKLNPDYYRYSFFPRTVREWNALPAQVVDAPTTSAFRARLMRCAGEE